MPMAVSLKASFIWREAMIQQNNEKPQISVTESMIVTAIHRGR